MIAASAQSSTSNNLPVVSTSGKATATVPNAGTGAVHSDITNASTTPSNARGEELFDIAQALTSLGRKVSGTDASTSSASKPSTHTTVCATQELATPASASNSAAPSPSSIAASETAWNSSTTCSVMPSSSSSSMPAQQQQQSNLADGPNLSENDPSDDQAYGRFPDILRLMMDYATAEGCKKLPYQRAASWSDDGKSIVILDKTLFCEQILPLFFKRTKFPSFVRKLFRWGFSRVTSKAIRRSKQQIFTHPKFVRLVPSNATSSNNGIPPTAAVAGAMTMPNAAFIQAQAGAVVPTSVSPLQVNAVSPRMTPPASDASQIPSVAMALSSNNGSVQTTPQEEVVAKLLARRQQLEVEWEILQEEAKLKGIIVGNAHQPLPSAALTGAAVLPSAATNTNFHHAHAHALGVGSGSTMLASSSMQPSLLEQAYYMVLNDANGTFRRVSLEPAPASAPAATTAAVPQALPGQSFFTPEAVRAAIAARAAASSSAMSRPQTATAAMVAGGHLPAPSLPGRPESERGIFSAAVQALHNSS